MGLSNGNLALLLAARHASSSEFEQVVTLGRLDFWPKIDFLSTILRIIDTFDSAEQVLSSVNGDGSFFLSKYLRSTNVDEIDASPFEGASIIHDMNYPIPGEYHQQFDFLYDGGTTEHIFDVRQVFANINDLVKSGGCVAVSVPANNQLGHGFYQFSPELYYRYFSPMNGYIQTAVFLCENHQLPIPRFWHVKDPAILKKRIQIQNSKHLNLLCIALKGIHVAEPSIPQQSDYAYAWRKSEKDGIASITSPPSAPPSAPPSVSSKRYHNVLSIPRRLVRKLISKTTCLASRSPSSTPSSADFRITTTGPSLENSSSMENGIEELSLDAFLSYRFTS
jgi:SAM-dependent methyltransferase